MAKRIPEETKEEIHRLYANNLRLQEIAKRTGVPYNSVYNITVSDRMINPETGKYFDSYREYMGYLVRQRINPETGEHFTSEPEYRSYMVMRRRRKKRNIKSGKLIKNGLKKIEKDSKWLAEQLGISRQAVSNYI